MKVKIKLPTGLGSSSLQAPAPNWSAGPTNLLPHEQPGLFDVQQPTPATVGIASSADLKRRRPDELTAFAQTPFGSNAVQGSGDGGPPAKRAALAPAPSSGGGGGLKIKLKKPMGSVGSMGQIALTPSMEPSLGAMKAQQKAAVRLLLVHCSEGAEGAASRVSCIGVDWPACSPPAQDATTPLLLRRPNRRRRSE
jgi:hypothetical protein